VVPTEGVEPPTY